MYDKGHFIDAIKLYFMFNNTVILMTRDKTDKT